jgi:hypothetical protein
MNHARLQDLGRQPADVHARQPATSQPAPIQTVYLWPGNLMVQPKLWLQLLFVAYAEVRIGCSCCLWLLRTCACVFSCSLGCSEVRR